MYDVISNDKKASARLFENEFFERLSHIHPATPVVFWSPVVVYFFYQALLVQNVQTVVGLFLAGFFLWTLCEYLMHKHLFHWKGPLNETWGKRLLFLFHGVHHGYPRDGTRLVFPLPASIPLAFLFYLLFTFVFKTSGVALFSGFVAGYITYDTMHYAIHHWPMRNPVAKAIKQHHLIHHYAAHDKAFGVSSMLWDVVFRTLPTRENHKQVEGRE